MGLWDVEAPTFSRQSVHRWRWGCQPYAPAALYPPGKFLVLISVRGWVDPRSVVRLERLGKLKKSTSSGLEPRDLPTCSIVPQPTTCCTCYFLMKLTPSHYYWYCRECWRLSSDYYKLLWCSFNSKTWHRKTCIVQVCKNWFVTYRAM
jgi:hypothetical protein